MKNKVQASEVRLEVAKVVSYNSKHGCGLAKTASGEMIAFGMDACVIIEADKQGPYMSDFPLGQEPKVDDELIYARVEDGKLQPAMLRWSHYAYWQQLAEKPAPIATPAPAEKPVASPPPAQATDTGNGDNKGITMTAVPSTPAPAKCRTRRELVAVTELDLELRMMPQDELERLARGMNGSNGREHHGRHRERQNRFEQR